MRPPARFTQIAACLSVLACLLVLAPALRAGPPQKTPKDAAEGFRAGVYHGKNGEQMNYRLFVPPGYDPVQPYPIVLWLHNAAASGSDNLAQISETDYLGAHAWTSGENLQKYHAFVLAPQVPDAKGWSRPRGKEMPPNLRLALDILDSVEAKYHIDRERVYVAGESLGGEGVWRALAADPHRFAAAVALCGYGDAWEIPHVAKIPVWVFQGQDDATVDVHRARDWVAELKKAGGAPKYTEYPAIGHNVWDLAFSEPTLVDWLFSHRRPDAK
jgi:predicted peptidase